MEQIKKSFNITGDVAQRVDDFIKANPGVSFTLVVNQALMKWLEDPKITLNLRKPMTDDEIDQFMKDNSDLMDDLSK